MTFEQENVQTSVFARYCPAIKLKPGFQYPSLLS